jgi:mannan polymerase II complex ANP1 subunit
MGFSVVGLPHYTIWHLYEPSVDDLKHMEEMEKERRAREEEEKAQAERAQRTETYFRDPKVESEIDNAFVRDSVEEEEKAKHPTPEKGDSKAAEKDSPATGKYMLENGHDDEKSAAQKQGAKGNVRINEETEN